VKVGDELQVVVQDLDEQGAGLGASPSDATLELHVQGGLPGETVTACLDHVSHHRPVGWALLRHIDRPSPARVRPACAAYGPCGGCVLQHFDYAAQVAWKERAFRARFAALPALADVAIKPVVPSPVSLGYRNKSKLVAGRDQTGRLILGAYAPRSHAVVDLTGCAVAEPPLDAVAATLRDLLAAQGIQPYDEVRLRGTLRYVVLRANADGAVLVTLVTATDDLPEADALVSALRAAHPVIAGVVQNVNPSRGNAIFGTHERTLAGASTFEDRIGDVRLRVSSRAFLQANRHIAAVAYARLAEAVALTGPERVIDAYAGVGGIALTLAPRAAAVVGFEEHAAAVDDAAVSAALNGIGNARFVAGDAGELLARESAADVVVLNPPRKGCAPAVLDRVAALGPRTVAYLSCAPETLARDLELLHQRGYRTRDITPLDMLPHTPHLEALAILDRQT
jgi:23S rRNA (uracil1939-C5)-methyltransferase